MAVWANIELLIEKMILTLGSQAELQAGQVSLVLREKLTSQRVQNKTLLCHHHSTTRVLSSVPDSVLPSVNKGLGHKQIFYPLVYTDSGIPSDAES